MKVYYIPEILFSLLVVGFLFMLPIYDYLKFVFIVAYFILFFLVLIEQWYRSKTVEKVKNEKQNYVNQKIKIVQERQEAIENMAKEREIQRLKEEEEYKQKIEEQRKKDEEETKQFLRERQKESLKTEIVHYLQGFVNKNFKVLLNQDFINLMAFIESNNVDRRIVFAPGVSSEKIKNLLPGLEEKLDNSLEKVVGEAQGYQENLKNFINLLTDKGFKVDELVLDDLIQDEVAIKKYQLFKNSFYAEKKALRYTNEVNDYIQAFLDLYGNNALTKIDSFVQLLAEDVDRHITRDLIEPLIQQELSN